MGASAIPSKLAKPRNGRIRAGEADIVKSLQGNWRDQHLFALKQALTLYDAYGQTLTECDQQLAAILERLARHQALWESSTGPWQLAAAKATAKKLLFDVDTLVVRDDSEFDQELADGMRRKPDALVLLSSPLVRARSKAIAEFCVRQRLPAISPFNEFPQAGGLMSYGPNVQDFYLRAAAFVDKILKGARAGELPLSMPTQFQLVFNQRAAAQLGLVPPPALLAAANEVMR